MNVYLKPFNADGTVIAPPSKSFAHRYLILAYLSGGNSVVNNVGDSEDVAATLSALTAIGARVRLKDGNAYFSENAPAPEFCEIDCGESGSTLRFMMPVVAALGINARFTGKGRLMQRPVSDMENAVNGHGAIICDHAVTGRLSAGTYTLNASVSSQFVSGLLLALSAVKGESRIILTGKEVSAGYVEITLSALKEYGVTVRREKDGFIITGGTYKRVKEITAEGDWSGATFPLCIGAVTGRVTVKGLKYPSLQSDCKIVKILQDFGADITVDKNGVTAKRGNLYGVTDIYCENVPDAVQAICAVASFCKGVTTLTGVERLRYKESDRISAVIGLLERAGIRAEYKDGTLTVFGGKPTGGKFDGGKDHRTVMSAAVIACGAEGDSVIEGAEYVAKSYRGFFGDLKRIGGTDVDF